MPHPKKLIELCVEKLSSDYPLDEYNYLYERGIPGERIIPDIQILKENKIICVSEIGYTRPDKIKRYRELGIQDIRWYSKEINLVLHERDSEKIKKEFEKRTTEKILKKVKEEHSRKIEEILANPFYFVFMGSGCAICSSENMDDGECGETIYFNKVGYQVFFECDNNEDHDYDEYYKWHDEDGPYYKQLDQFLKEYVDMRLSK